MIKTRNQLEAVQDLLLSYAAFEGLPVTIEQVAFTLDGGYVVALPAGGLTLAAEFTVKAIRRILSNPRDCICYLLATCGDVYDEAFGLLVQINAPEEADGTGRPVFYGELIDHTASGHTVLTQVIRHPKRKAKKVPALGFMGGSVKLTHKAPKKAKGSKAYLPTVADHLPT